MKSGWKWARCANCAKATWYCAKHGCKPAPAKYDVTAPYRAAGFKVKGGTHRPTTKETNMETINMTPRGMETPEGIERVNKAAEAHNNAMVNVANLATQFLKTYGYEILKAMEELGEPATEEWEDLMQAIKDRTAAQEEFLRAVAGAPAAK